MSLERYERIAAIGGVYSNHLALEAAVNDAQRRGVDAIFCQGDLGAFGPSPDKVFPILMDAGVQVMQGNYDNSIGAGLADCQCGYVDPRDNHFAKLSYDYHVRQHVRPLESMDARATGVHSHSTGTPSTADEPRFAP